MDRNLIDYLPIYLHQYTEVQAIMGTEQVNWEEFWLAVRQVCDNQFIESADENGIARWEGILGIAPKSTSTLEERRFTILTTLNFSLPYTYKKLQEILTNICGEDNFRTSLKNKDYRLIVKLGINNTENYDTVKNLLRSVCPANLIVDVYMFNIHLLLKPFTHAQLKAYTHSELRTEILE